MSPKAEPLGFIGELCVALAHRWEAERLFMVFTAHFDEAASHGPNPRLTMGALLGNAYEWRRCETRLKRIQASYGFTIFHAKDFKAHKGKFKGWKPEAYQALVVDLSELIRQTLAEGVAVTLPREHYLSEYRTAPVPSGMPLDSQYGLCFRACLAHVGDAVLSRGNHILHVVIEEGHTNLGDTIRIFKEIKALQAERGIDLLGTITPASKQDAPPLMVADFLAHTNYIMDAIALERGVSIGDLGDSQHQIRPRDAGLTFLQFQEGSLRQQKELWAERKQRRMDQWRAARTARRALAQ